MHRNDNSNYFLYIEPKIEEKSADPVNDVYTEAVQWFFDNSESGTIYGYSNLNDLGNSEDFSIGNGWRGWHVNCDGEESSNRDYLFSNGLITNFLCVHYTRWFRNSIVGPNLEKLEILKDLFLSSKR